MQVTCPNCGARYAVDPLAIGPSGRPVQCARCNLRWFQTVEPRARTSPAFALEEESVPDFVIRPRPSGASLPALTSPRKKGGWVKAMVPIAVLVALLAVAIFAFRDQIATQLAELPQSPAEWRTLLRLDALLPSPAPAVQLEIDLATSKVELVDGRYIVRGEVVNNGSAASSSRTLKVVFKKADEVLGERSYPLIEGPIAPGARVSFARELEDVPSGTTDIVPAVE